MDPVQIYYVVDPVKLPILTSCQLSNLKAKGERFIQPESLLSFGKVGHSITDRFPLHFDFIKNIKIYSNRKVLKCQVECVFKETGKTHVIGDCTIISCNMYQDITISVQLDGNGFLQVTYEAVSKGSL